MSVPGGQSGAGTAGCLMFVALAGVLVFVGFRIGPDYYAYKNFETDVQREVARAGAQFLDDEAVLNNILMLGKRNELSLKQENVKLERFAGQLHVTVRYTVLVDLMVYQTDHEYIIRASSFVGRL